MSITLRRATREDTAAIAALLGQSYDANPKADPAVLEWQYWDNPYGPARSWVAQSAGELVGHWAAVPVPVLVAGRAVAAAKGVDIATHPAHRRHGVFRQVARALLDDCRGQVEVLLTHPNPNSAGAVGAAGARLVGTARAHVRPLEDAFLARRAHLPHVLVGLARRTAFPDRKPAEEPARTRGPAEDLDDLWERVARSRPTGIVRDLAWWRWRYQQRPGAAYDYVEVRRDGTLSGAAVCTVQERYGGRFALVLEFIADDRPAARGLVHGLSVLGRARGAAGLVAVALPGGAQAATLRAAGLRRLPRLLEPQPLRVMVAVPGGDPEGVASLAWSMSWGDLDHL